MPCFPAPSEVSGCFVGVDKEDPARERRHQSALVRSGVDTLDVGAFRGGAKSWSASANGCGIELCVRPGECLICQSIPWTRCMHVGAVSTINYYVRNHLLSENDARGVKPT